MEISVRFIVDEPHCQRAKDELFAMLLRQDRAMVDRWYARLSATDMAIKVLCWLGSVVSILGFVACALVIVANGEFGLDAKTFVGTVLFLGFAVAFPFLPRLRKPIYVWGEKRSAARCRRYAEKIISQAARLAPYEANFDFKGDLLLYCRGKNGAWTLAWQHHLKKFAAQGIAVQHSSVTAIFRRPTSIYPAIAILHQQSDWVAEALTDAGITVIAANCNDV